MASNEAEPYEDSGPDSMCINCYESVRWYSGEGWLHWLTREKICKSKN